MPPKKSSIGRKTSKARLEGERRSQETNTERTNRLNNDRISTAAGRSNESFEDRQNRLDNDRIATAAGRSKGRRIKNSKCKDSNQLPPETSNLGTSSNFTAQSTPWEFIDVLKKEPGLQKDDGNKEITVKEEIPIKEEIEVEEETLFPPETTKDSFLTFEFENCSDFDNKPYAILPAIETDGRDSELVNGHKAINLNHIKEENRTNDSSFCSENTTYNRININEGTIKVSRKDKELPDRLNSDNLDEEDELIIPEMQLHHRVSPRLPWPEEEESSGAEIDEDPLSIELEDLEERNSLYHKAPSRTRSREQESTAHSFETHKKRTKIDN